MEIVSLIEGIDRLLEKFGRVLVYRKQTKDGVKDWLVEGCLNLRTRISGRLEPYELVQAGFADRTGYQILIPDRYGFIPSIDDVIFVPKSDGRKLVYPITFLDFLRVTNVLDVFYEHTTIAYTVYCIRDDRLRGAFLG